MRRLDAVSDMVCHCATEAELAGDEGNNEEWGLQKSFAARHILGAAHVTRQ
jgi:hypothetical protein